MPSKYRCIEEKKTKGKVFTKKTEKQKGAAKVGMRKKRELDLLNVEEHQAQREAAKVGMRRKRELDSWDVEERQVQRDAGVMVGSGYHRC